MTNRWLAAATLIVSLTPSAAEAATERLRGIDRVDTALIAFDRAPGGRMALAYDTARGLRLSTSVDGTSFRRARALVRGKGFTLGYDEDIEVATSPNGWVLVVWTRDDESDPEEDYDRDGGCCSRVRAAIVDPSGRIRRSRDLSPEGVDANLGPAAIGPNGRAVVTWQRGWEYGPWDARIALRGGRWGARRTLVAGGTVLAGDVEATTRGFVAVGVGRVRGATYVLERVATGSRFGRARRLVRPRTSAFDATFEIDAAGGFVGLMEAGRSADRLLFGGPDNKARVVRAGLSDSETLRLQGSPSGAAVLLGHRLSSRTVRYRFRSPGGAFGPVRRVTLADRPLAYATLAGEPGATGAPAIFGLSRQRRSITGVYLSVAGRRGRRIGTFRGAVNMEAATSDSRGRPLAIVSTGRGIYAVRP